MKKGDKLIKKLIGLLGSILLGGIGLIIGNSLFMYILDLGINVFSGIIISGAVISIVGVLSKLPECIKKEVVYEVNGYEISDNSEYLREQLHVVKSNDKVEINVKKVDNSKYSYVFDNEYKDDLNYDDVIIDDMSDFFVQEDCKFFDNAGYSRCKNKYNGRYLR